ncbi:hypothetical protein ACFO3I_12845 [Rheinheimera marina]|uniref:Uncharacterized protein n=1 Tax=Rheinheimera marina TaxID=1774958 RepID=A0ABV9JNR4_9GAMM
MSALKRKLPEPQPYFSPRHWTVYLTEQERQALQQVWNDDEPDDKEQQKAVER